jgi:hypothetical protein
MFEQQFARLPEQPPRTLENLPGLAIFAVVPTSARLLPLVFALFIMAIPLSIMRLDPAQRLHWGRANDVQGTVVSAADSSCRGAAARRLVYAFTAGERGAYRGTALVCQGTLDYSIQTGDAVQRRYLASDPAVKALRGVPDNAPPVATFLAMPLLLLAFAAVYAPQLREILQARRLISQGQLTDGSVLFVKPRNNLSRPSWQSGGGTRREAVAWCGNDWLVGQWTAGSKVHLAYLDRTPGKVALLEAFVR